MGPQKARDQVVAGRCADKSCVKDLKTPHSGTASRLLATALLPSRARKHICTSHSRSDGGARCPACLSRKHGRGVLAELRVRAAVPAGGFVAGLSRRAGGRVPRPRIREIGKIGADRGERVTSPAPGRDRPQAGGDTSGHCVRRCDGSIRWCRKEMCGSIYLYQHRVSTIVRADWLA